MNQSVFVSVFDVESEAYQAFSELKQNPGDEKSFLSQVALTKKEGDEIKVIDSFDTGAATMNDMAIGGLLGACMGILGGPLGVLLFGSYGALVGSAFDTVDALDQASMIEQIAGKMQDDLVIVGVVAEEDESILDEKLAKFKTTVMRYDAAVVAQEVEDARETEAEMARQARAAMRKEKSDEFKSKVETRREKMKEQFAEFKKSLK